jgi:hypothetical protein
MEVVLLKARIVVHLIYIKNWDAFHLAQTKKNKNFINNKYLIIMSMKLYWNLHHF